jgi:hypothetical protein
VSKFSAPGTASDNTKNRGPTSTHNSKRIQATKATWLARNQPRILMILLLGFLAGIPKMRVEEVTEGVSSTSLDEGCAMPAIESGDELKEEEDGDNDEYDERDDYGSGGYGPYDNE